MTITTEIKREYKKLSSEMEAGQRRMKALEGMMREYKIWHYPYSEAISDMVLDFVMGQEGEASFEAITCFLEEKNIEIPSQKLSLVLNRNPQLHYKRQSQTWEIRKLEKEAAA